MRTSRCSCGNWLFFDSTRCVACGRVAGFCPQCHAIRDLIAINETTDFQCGRCARRLRLCRNAGVEQICNICVAAAPDQTSQPLCGYCRFTQVIPDLSIEGNRQRWGRLERAKRRVLVGLENLDVPLQELQSSLPLRFAFKADTGQPVATGHEHGLITINIREADDIEREKTRVACDEPQRTLVGHFRHELGHYFWELLVEPGRLEEFRVRFGDECDPSYADAQQTYYAFGPPADWSTRFVSAYAAMHPWEDFAETFQTYLDLRAVLETAEHFDSSLTPGGDFDQMLTQYQSLGIMANEWNRDLGLLDLVPEVFGGAVKEKLHFVHRVMTDSAES